MLKLRKEREHANVIEEFKTRVFNKLAGLAKIRQLTNERIHSLVAFFVQGRNISATLVDRLLFSKIKIKMIPIT